MNIGIDALAFATPRAYLELTDLAAARNIPAEKLTKGIGAVRMAVARSYEDPVALAADAALRLFAHAGIDRSSIGYCAVGTETGIDHSKPIASYVHGLLGLPANCRVFDTKHACFGGTAALLAATEWIASGAARGRKALVICTDIARYELNTAGEPTQGAGAVAVLISESPRLVELEVGKTGSFARDVHDFWRPLDRKDALVDGHFSVTCYLDAIAGAYTEWKKEDSSGEALARTVYHVPYVKMARKADKHRAVAVDGLDEAAAEARYDREVEPSLRFAAEVGNIYTGSMYLALASLLHFEASTLAGKRIGFFSYGSGCGAEFFAGRVTQDAHVWAKALREPLDRRERIDFAEYEKIRQADALPTPKADVARTLPSDRTVFLGSDEAERRVYRLPLTKPASASSTRLVEASA
jgi:hydroxymethylglutaryl-CoA synthase